MRAQASLEFLVTYGWAIALTMATLSWLVYMGLNSPTTFAGESCRVSGEFGCEEAKLSTSSAASEASFVLRNLQQEKIFVQNVTVQYDSQEFTCTRFQNLDGSDLMFARSGEKFEVLCNDDNLFLPEGEKAKLSFTITYNKSAGFSRKASGEIVGLVDEKQAPLCEEGEEWDGSACVPVGCTDDSRCDFQGDSFCSDEGRYSCYTDSDGCLVAYPNPCVGGVDCGYDVCACEETAYGARCVDPQ